MIRYRCLECRKVQDINKECNVCGGKTKEITIHVITPKNLISTVRGTYDKYKKG